MDPSHQPSCSGGTPQPFLGGPFLVRPVGAQGTVYVRLCSFVLECRPASWFSRPGNLKGRCRGLQHPSISAPAEIPRALQTPQRLRGGAHGKRTVTWALRHRPRAGCCVRGSLCLWSPWALHVRNSQVPAMLGLNGRCPQRGGPWVGGEVLRSQEAVPRAAGLLRRKSLFFSK